MMNNQFHSVNHLILFLIFTCTWLAPFTLLTVYADCPPNSDWHDAPCLDQTNPDLLEKAKKEWARYADIKSEKSLELSKTEMINAIQYDVLEEWLSLRNSSRNQNIYAYFSIYDANMDDYFELPKKDKFDGTCIILIDLKNAKEILRNDKIITRFFEMYPDAVFGPVGGVDESSPPQSSVSLIFKNVILYVRVLESHEDQCFVPVSYKIVSNNDKIKHYIRDAEISNLYPVLKQLEAGLAFDQLVCPDKLVLVQKYDDSPACVKTTTSEVLREREWLTCEHQRITHGPPCGAQSSTGVQTDKEGDLQHRGFIEPESTMNENGTVSENKKPYTLYDISGVKQTYKAGEPISFTETVQGYANPCVHPYYEILDGNTLETVWQYKIVYPCPFIKGPQQFKTTNTVPNDNIHAPILNQTGHYILRSYYSYSDEYKDVTFSVVDESNGGKENEN